MTRKKSDVETPIESPIAFRPCSNGEFSPPPETKLDRLAEARFRRLVESKSRRLGMSRRAFARSACGYVTALSVINDVYGCGGSGADPDASASDGSSLDVGIDVPGFDVSPDAMEDAGLACETVLGGEFIFDVQTHTASPLTPWRDAPLPATAEDYIRMLFVGSDTSVACLSGIPAARDLALESPEARRMIEEIVDRLAGPRLNYHVNVDPLRGPSELDFMEQAAESYEIAAWKVYPHEGPWRLDDAENGMPFIAKARELGVRIVAAHRGIAGDNGAYDAASSPIDLVRAARMSPDISFLAYHSGWERNISEDHAFDPDNTDPRGVDRLVRAVIDEGIGPGGNVYAELGSTWRSLMTAPTQAAHVLGKLLLHLGEDRIVWGTDSVFTGTPQEQIVAFRTFQIPERMQERFGYPALTDEIRAKIFGLNAANVYGIDVDQVRCEIEDDFLDRLRTAHRLAPEAIPVPEEKRWGPRTRREFFAFLRWERYAG